MASKIGAQMFTLREFTKTPADVAVTLKRVREIGFEAIQVSAFGPIEVTELAKLVREAGLTVAATHVSLDMMKDVNQCVEYHEALGCKLPAIGGAGHLRKATAKSEVIAFAKEYSQIAGPLAERGLRVGYHNHSFELARVEGERILDLLIEHTDPAIWFEIDTYWIQHGGGDPAQWISKVADRACAIHVKDFQISTTQEPIMCEVGDGNLNWPRILESSRDAGVAWYLIERDNGVMNPFDSLERSLRNLQAMPEDWVK